MKIHSINIVGLEEAIRAMRQITNTVEESDSYWTHIEDPQTLETAKYEFFVGEKDYKFISELDTGNLVDMLSMITVYATIEAPEKWWYDMAAEGYAFFPESTREKRTVIFTYFSLAVTYACIRYLDYCFEGYEELIAWIESLPYSEWILKYAKIYGDSGYITFDEEPEIVD